MKIKRLEVKKIIIPSVISLVIFLIIFSCLIKIQLDNYNKIFNYKVESIITEIKEKYPETDEEEVIQILQSGQSVESGKEILKQYGYEGNENYIEEMNKLISKYIVMDIALIGGFFIIIIFIGIKFVAKQNNEINDINMYLKKINNGKYDLKINENVEDELSKLKNELYKTTVLLRETAEYSRKEKENLSISLEDISHQLKTPLTSIRIMIDNLYENSDMDINTRKDFLKTISKQLDWISSLVISILKIAKFDSGTIVMNDKKINAQELINDVIANLSILLEIKNIEIIKEIPSNASFKADYKWQLEALINIVKNSIEHSKENSKINIKVEDSSLFLKVLIQDFGDGISKQDINHIFERFYKAKDASEDSIGIGLALSKTIIEKDNGYITVKSDKGKGTTFEVKYMKNIIG